MTSPFTRKKCKIECNIPYNAIHNITQAILDYLDQLLLKHSYTIKGILVSYEVEQYSLKNKIYPDSPFLFIDCIVDMLILDFDHSIYSDNGNVFGLLECEDKHTGYIMVKEVNEKNVITKYIVSRNK